MMLYQYLLMHRLTQKLLEEIYANYYRRGFRLSLAYSILSSAVCPLRRLLKSIHQ